MELFILDKMNLYKIKCDGHINIVEYAKVYNHLDYYIILEISDFGYSILSENLYYINLNSSSKGHLYTMLKNKTIKYIRTNKLKSILDEI